jgi:hypothetical protein
VTQVDVPHLIELIYNSVFDPTEWLVFLEGFADAVQGSTTALIWFDLSRPASSEVFCCRFDPSYRRKCEDHFSASDPWLAAATAKLKPDSSSIAQGDELVDLEELRRGVFYADYLVPQQTVHEIGCLLVRTNEDCVALTSLRAEQKGPFSDGIAMKSGRGLVKRSHFSSYLSRHYPVIMQMDDKPRLRPTREN